MKRSIWSVGDKNMVRSTSLASIDVNEKTFYGRQMQYIWYQLTPLYVWTCMYGQSFPFAATFSELLNGFLKSNVCTCTLHTQCTTCTCTVCTLCMWTWTDSVLTMLVVFLRITLRLETACAAGPPSVWLFEGVSTPVELSFFEVTLGVTAGDTAIGVTYWVLLSCGRGMVGRGCESV